MLRLASAILGGPVGSVVLLLLPSAAYAQAAITGVVKDASGGVLPGVTVEAASPALIEKVRSVVTDDTGQYRIVDLRPGTYSVTFTLPGFSTVKREGIELTGTFVATVNGDLKVGALEETITVTGETPVVDVQSAKVQQTVSKDVLAAIPTSRTAGGITALIPGMSSSGDSGGIGGRHRRRRRDHPRRPRERFAHLQRRPQHRAGPAAAAAGGNMAERGRAQEVVLSTSGGLGEAETAGVILNVDPARGRQHLQRHRSSANGANGAMQGSNYTQSLKDQGLKAPSETHQLYEINPMGGGRIVRDKLWFYIIVPPDSTARARSRACGSTRTPATRTPGRSISTRASRRLRKRWIGSGSGASRGRRRRATRSISAGRSRYNASGNWKGGGTATHDDRSDATDDSFEPSHMQQATWSSPITSRLLVEAGWGTYQARYRNPGAADRRHASTRG